MRRPGLLALGALIGAGITILPRSAQRVQAASALEHTERKFEFVANAPSDIVGPLFGADRERVWSANWNPNFLWPAQPSDQPGMVFTVAHGHTNAVWVNTDFDLKNGRVQYVYTIPDALVTVITLKLTPEGKRTRVAVQYDRTALSADANEHVRRMAAQDGKAGPEWEKQINAYLVTIMNIRP